MNIHDLRVIKTKKAIHEAVLELLNEKNLEHISITEICKKAQVNRGTFYLHYEKKEDIFEEFLEELMEDLTDAYEEPYRHTEKIITSNLDSNHIRIFHHVKKYSSFYKIVFAKNSSLNYQYMFYEKIKSLFKKDFTPIQQLTINKDLLLSYQANAIVGLIMEWSLLDFSYSAEYMSEQLIQILQLKG